MLFITGALRLVFIGIILYLIFIVVRFIQAIGRPRASSGAERSARRTMVKDEICNMYLPVEEAVREIRDGQEHYFCSDECRRKYLDSLKES